MRKLIFAACLAISIVACKPKDNPAPSCATNEVRKGDTCACNDNSVRFEGKCEDYAINSRELVYAPVLSSCNDWRKSLRILMDSTKKLEYWTTDSKGLVGHINFSWIFRDDLKGYNENDTWGNTYCHYKSGIQYDTLMFDGRARMLGDHPGTYNMYAVINKNRDTIFAKLSSTTDKPLAFPVGYYPDLDSCFYTMVRIK